VLDPDRLSSISHKPPLPKTINPEVLEMQQKVRQCAWASRAAAYLPRKMFGPQSVSVIGTGQGQHRIMTHGKTCNAKWARKITYKWPNQFNCDQKSGVLER